MKPVLQITFIELLQLPIPTTTVGDQSFNLCPRVLHPPTPMSTVTKAARFCLSNHVGKLTSEQHNQHLSPSVHRPDHVRSYMCLLFP